MRVLLHLGRFRKAAQPSLAETLGWTWSFCLFLWRAQGESNPCFRRERATSWTARRWARKILGGGLRTFPRPRGHIEATASAGKFTAGEAAGKARPRGPYREAS